MKNWFKFAFYTTFLGWFPFLWISLFNSYGTVEVRLGVFFTGFILCIIGGFAFTGLSANKGFWLKNDELNELIERHKEAIKKKEEETQKLIKKILDNEQD